MIPRIATRARPAGDGGAAMIEFVFLAVLVMVPLLYLVIAVFELQRNAFAVTQAAREAGRALVTADDVAHGEARARYAAELAVRDQGLDPGGMVVRFGPVGSGCPADGAPTLEPGADFEVCVTQPYRLPGIGPYFQGGDNTVTGRYVVHVDDFRSGG